MRMIEEGDLAAARRELRRAHKRHNQDRRERLHGALDRSLTPTKVTQDVDDLQESIGDELIEAAFGLPQASDRRARPGTVASLREGARAAQSRSERRARRRLLGTQAAGQALVEASIGRYDDDPDAATYSKPAKPAKPTKAKAKIVEARRA